MNAPNVRSATVRLNAEVAKYIADVKAAGKATDDAFSRADAAVKRVDADLQSATRSSDRLATSTRGLKEETDRSTTSREKTTKSVKEYTLQAAIADERTKRLRTSLRDQAKAAVDAETGLNQATSASDRAAVSIDRTGNAIDRTSGRLALLAKGLAVVGPGLIPFGAVGAAGLAGLASQIGFVTLGMSTLLIAAQGVGTAIEAVEKARLDPTIQNIRAARDALDGLDPAAQAFVQRFQELRPVLADIRNAAQAGFFPGLTVALDTLEAIAPQVADIVQALGATGGNLISDAADALAGPEWGEFLDFIEREAPQAFDDLGRTVGNVVSGMADLWMAFAPVNRDFSSWLLDASRGFAEWADGLSQTEGFQEFISYVRENGPLVADAVVAIANAVLQIVQAAAPLGGPILRAITGIANAIAAIADSPLGTPIMAAVTAMSALSLASAAATASVTRLNAAMATLGVTSKKAGLAAGAGTAGAAAAGGAGGLPLIAAILGVTNLIDNAQQLFSGDMPLWEFGLRGMVPLIDHLEMFGINVLGAEKNLAPFAMEIVNATRAGIELDAALGKTASRFEQLRGDAGDLDPVLARTTRAMRDQARATREQERASARADRQAERTAARMEAQAEAIRANQAAAQQAAEGFVNFGRVVKRSEFTLDGWLDKLENQTDAMRRFRENAIRAGEQGVNRGLIQHLRELGPEGAAQLAELADASEAEIARANRAWRSFRRESRLAGQSIGPVQAAFDRLGGSKAEPTVNFRGTDEAIVAARAARAAIIAIPDKSDTTIDENGAAEVAAAAARARAAVLSIPQSRTSTLTFRTIGTPGFSSGGYTGAGRRDEPAGVVHRGEVVIPQPLVRRDWSMLKSRYGHLPGFDSGGHVGGPVFTRSSDSAATREMREETTQRKRLNAQLKEAEKAVERERRQRDDLVSKMREVASGIRSGLTTDLGENASVWSGGFGFAGDMATLGSDTKRGQRWNRLVKILRDKGFDGPALADLLSRGDINEVADYARQSRGALARFEEAFADRAGVLRVAGREGAEAALGKRLDTANDELREANRRLHRLEQAANRGNRDRKDEHDKDRDAQRRGAGNAARNRRRNP